MAWRRWYSRPLVRIRFVVRFICFAASVGGSSNAFGMTSIRDHAFVKQAELECLLGDDLLQRAGLLAQRLDLVAGSRTGRVTGQAAFMGSRP
jgi:hypothetical protein